MCEGRDEVSAAISSCSAPRCRVVLSCPNAAEIVKAIESSSKQNTPLPFQLMLTCLDGALPHITDNSLEELCRRRIPIIFTCVDARHLLAHASICAVCRLVVASGTSLAAPHPGLYLPLVVKCDQSQVKVISKLLKTENQLPPHVYYTAKPVALTKLPRIFCRALTETAKIDLKECDASHKPPVPLSEEPLLTTAPRRRGSDPLSTKAVARAAASRTPPKLGKQLPVRILVAEVNGCCR